MITIACDRQLAPDVEFLFDRLMQLEERAEIVDGRIIIAPPRGAWQAQVAGEIMVSLHDFVRGRLAGHVVGGGAVFCVNLPHRATFTPDTGDYVGPVAGMEPFEGAPVFAVEIRSLSDYGPRAERLLAEKRADYFACGTQVVWDVKLCSNDVVKVYRASAPDQPVVYRPGDIADAEPAVTGWTVPVSSLLPDDWERPEAEALPGELRHAE